MGCATPSIRSSGGRNGAARHPEPRRRIPDRFRRVPRRRRRLAPCRRTRGARHRRRIRFRQVGVDAGGDGPAAVDGDRHRRPYELRRPRSPEDEPGRAPQDRRQGHVDDLPGADGQPQPLLHRRLPDRGGPALSYGHGPRAAPGSRHRTVEAGRHPRTRRAAEFLSASDVGRPVSARHDRHCHCLQSEAVDRRRTDHRARRHHPEADPRSAGLAAGQIRHGPDHDHPQYGRGGGNRRPRYRPV